MSLVEEEDTKETPKQAEERLYETAISKPKTEASRESKPDNTLTLDFYPSEL